MSDRNYGSRFARSGSKTVTRKRRGTLPFLAKRRLMLEPLEQRLVLDSSAGPLVISEFMASNTKIIDDLGQSKSDWIEIHNISPTETIALDGWYLTDSAGNKTKWKVPDPTPAVDFPIAPGGYVIVWATNPTTPDPAHPLHAGFKLSNNAGSYLGLVKPDGVNVASDYSAYPTQYSDISYGVDSQAVVGYFQMPTPGSANNKDAVPDLMKQVVINEIMYNTARGSAGTLGYVAENTAQDYVELYNKSSTSVNLKDWQLDKWWFALQPIKVVSGITHITTTATVTMPVAPGYAVGDSVLITGATQSQYNGVFTVASVNGASFTYQMASDPGVDAGGVITAQKGPRQVGSIASEDYTATVTMPNHGFAEGDTILVSGADQDAYNGVFTIANVTPSTFTYTLLNQPTTAATGTILAQKASQQFPDVSIAANGYLVVAADGKAFREKYPTVTNVVAAYTAKMANNGETITLRGSEGTKVDEVSYSNQGDWGVRTRGEQLVTGLTRSGNSVTITVPYHGYTIADRAEDKVYRIYSDTQTEFNGEWTVTAVTRDTMTFTIAGSATTLLGRMVVQKKDAGHYGWDWYSGADGNGTSLELISSAMSNKNGENWAASTALTGSTPGAANSVVATDIAPLISDVTHFPVIPRSTDPVTIQAKVTDELVTGLTVMAYYRLDGASSFTPVVMYDDGLHGDQAANDGLYGASLPAQANNAVVEFYVTATDAAAHTRQWPAAPGLGGVAPATLYSGQTANLLYQVDNTYNPNTAWTAGGQPVYRLIMKAADRQELATMGSVNPDRWSDAVMNGTFITVDGTGVECEYQAGFRNRGHGTRVGVGGANNYKIEIPNDRSWKGYNETIVNYQNTPSQVLGSVVWHAAGLSVPNEQPIQVRVNGVNYARTDSLMYGSYVAKEQYNSDFVASAFPDDPNGNLYVIHYTDYPYNTATSPGGNLAYRGTNPDSYRDNYFKQTNVGQDDWSDLINMTRIMDVANPAGLSDAAWLQEASQVANIDEWFRYLALDTLLGNREGGLYSGQGDDFGLYRGVNDSRFQLVQWDVDTLTTWGSSDYTTNVFAGYNTIPGFGRLLTNPDTVGRYYAQLRDLCNTVFAAANFNPLVDQILGGNNWVPQAQRDAIKTWTANRVANVLSQIPSVGFTVSSPLSTQGGYPHTTTTSTSLSGTADPVTTRSVEVNGQPATFDSTTGLWTAGTSTGGGGTGVSDILINTGDDWKYFAARGFDVTGYQATIPVTNIATAESVISNPANRSGTWTDTPSTINYLNGSSGTGGTTYTFQEGVSGYAGTVDNYISFNDKANSHGTDTTMRVDRDVQTTNDPDEGLLRFDQVFGAGGAIPAGSQIVSAYLTLTVPTTPSNAYSVNTISLYRVAAGQSWNETATWNNSFGGNGIQVGTETAATANATVVPATLGTSYSINVLADIQAWLADPASNLGWAIMPGGGDAAYFETRESTTVANRPKLTIVLAGASSNADGHFITVNNNLPGQGTTPVDNFVVEAKYRVYIPAAGDWTFGVNSDDGFKLTLDNGVDPTRTATFDGPRSVADTLTTFTFANPGTYDLRLVYFDNTGAGGVELFAAKGAKAVFDSSFKLLGDIVGGGLSDSDQGTAWTDAAFNDSSWQHGPSQLGYGDGDEATVTTYVDADPNTAGVQKNVTTYFRRAFQVASTAEYNGLILHLVRDDGAVVYLNGVEVKRDNMPAGTIASTTWASGNVADETAWKNYPIDLSMLHVGTNVIAVEMHQYAANSGDISMDVRLEATRPGGASGTGLNLLPGLNRLVVQTFDGYNGTGTKLQEGTIEVWCDPTTVPADPPLPLADPPGQAANQHLNLQVRDSYVPGAPITVRVEIADELERVDRDVWNATINLTTDNPNVTLSASQVTLYNGMGSVLVVPTFNGTGSGDFTITASWNGKTVAKSLVNWGSQPQTTVSGTLAGNTTWSGIIHVTGTVIVPTGATLTIQPGTLVLLDGVTSGTAGVGLTVNGSVQSLGTATSPVTFTTSTYAAALAWGQIRHSNAAASLYQYTEIVRAGRTAGEGHTGTGPAVRPGGSTLVFDHSSISDNVGKIMYSDGGSSLTFRHSLLARSVMGPEIASTALLFENSFIEDMHNPDDGDGIYLHDQQAGQTITLRGGVVANVDDDDIDTLGSTILVDDMILRNSKDKGLSAYDGVINITRTLAVDNARAPEDGSQAAISMKTTEGTTGTVNIDRTTIYNDFPTGIGIQSRNKYGVATGRIVFNVTNSIIQAYQPAQVDTPVYSLDDVHISYTDLIGTLGLPWTYGGSHDNLMVSAQFVNAAGYDFRLQATSPAIDMGDPAGVLDPDGTRPDMGYRSVNSAGAYAPRTIAAGHLTQDMLMYPAANPYHVTGAVIVDAGATLSIMPGTQIFFDAGASLTINGRLVAEGTATQQIRFTAYPGAGTWGGLFFQGTTQDNRITYSTLEYGEGTHGISGTAMVAIEDSTLTLDHDLLDHATYRRIATHNSSLIVRNSTFTDIFAPAQAPTTNNSSEQIWGTNAPQGGQFIIENNVFGTTKGHNDVLDVDGGLAANGDPVPQILNNVFNGGGDEALDIEGDFYIEGNLFRNFHKDSYAMTQDPNGEANVISAGDAHLVGHHYTVIGNVFYEVDHAVLIKDKSFLTFLDNTVVNVTATKPAIYFDVINDSAAAGLSATIRDCIFSNVPIVVDLAVRSGAPAPVVTINNSLLPAQWHIYGTGNSAEAPRVASDFSLLPGSPGLGTGPFGLDKGGMVPGGATISGEPAMVTGSTGATLTIGGLGITAYRYRLNGGALSPEYPVATPLVISGLTNGTYTISVIGKNLAGGWQNETTATTRTWVVNTALRRVRINEVLAANVSAVKYEGSYADMIELVNDGAVPVDLSGMSLSDDPTNPDKFVFPAGTTLGPGSYLVLYGDGKSTPGLHVGFALDASHGGVYLYDTLANGQRLLDSVEYGPQVDNYSIGRLGADAHWALTSPTFGAANIATRTGNPATIKINEWLASGHVRLGDDFLELYNPDTLPVPLSGLYLTDNINAQPRKQRIAALSFAGAQRAATFWADGNDGANHLGFKLSAWQQWLGLSDAKGNPLDKVLYFSQTTDTSQGRSPDATGAYTYFALPTPGVGNSVPTAINDLFNNLRISELMYGPRDDADLEFIELKNISATVTLDLTGVRLNNAVDFTFPSMTLAPGQYVVVARNAAIFSEHFGPGINLAGQYSNKYGDQSDTVEVALPAPYDANILRFTYSDWWYPTTAVGGYSLVPKDATLALSTTLWDDATRWQAGTVLGGSPGRSDTGTIASSVIINEVLSHTDYPFYDSVEIYNPTNAAIDLTGWYISDTSGDRKFRIPDEPRSHLAPGAYAVFDDRDFNIAPYNGNDKGTGTSEAVGTEVHLKADPSFDAVWRRIKLAYNITANTVLTFDYMSSVQGQLHGIGFDTDEQRGDGETIFRVYGSGNGGTQALDTEGNYYSTPGVWKSYSIPVGSLLGSYAAKYLFFGIDDPSHASAESWFRNVTVRESGAAGTAIDFTPYFGLDGAHGDDLWLMQADPATGLVTGYVDHVSFGAAANPNGTNPESFGRWADSTGKLYLYPQVSRTLGSANSGPRVGPLLISEVMYAPQPYSLSPLTPLSPTEISAGFQTLDDLEYVEIYNPTSQLVPSLANWRLNKGVDYSFAAGQSLAAHQAILVVPFDPADPLHPNMLSTFRARYGISASVTVVGPYSGHLNDFGEKVQLLRPDTPPAEDPTFYPGMLEDEITYSPSWGANANGASLERIAATDWGDTAPSWSAAAPTAGSVTMVTALSVVSINLADANPTNAATLHFAVEFNRSVTGVTTDDFRLVSPGTASGTISSISGGGTSYIVTVTGVSGNGLLGLNLVDDDTIVDATDSSKKLGGTGTGNGNFTGQSYTIDLVAPTVVAITRVSDATTNATSVQFSVTFSEAVTAVGLNDFALACTGTAGTISGVGGSGNSYTVTVENISGNGTLGLNIVASPTVFDLATNPLGGGNRVGETYLIDTIAPTADVIDVTPDPRQTPVDTITIHFSEAVSGFGLDDLGLTRDGNVVSLAGASLTPGDGQTWTLGNLAGLTLDDGSYVLSLAATGSGIVDLAGNPLTIAASDAWSKTSGVIKGTAGNDVIHIVRRDLQSTLADVYINNEAVPAYSISITGASQWTVSGMGGNDRLVIDYAYPDLLPSGGVTFDGGVGDTLEIRGSNADDSVVVRPGVVNVGGGPDIGFSANDLQWFCFPLGSGNDTLTIDGAAISVNPADIVSIASSTLVTISGGGSLDLGVGHVEAVREVDLVDGTLVSGTLDAGSHIVRSGTVQGGLTGAGDLTKNDGGTVTLIGRNSYQGSTTVNDGQLVIQSSNALPEKTSLVIHGGTVVLDTTLDQAVKVSGLRLNLPRRPTSVTKTAAAVVAQPAAPTDAQLAVSIAQVASSAEPAVEPAPAVAAARVPPLVATVAVEPLTVSLVVQAASLPASSVAAPHAVNGAHPVLAARKSLKTPARKPGIAAKPKLMAPLLPAEKTLAARDAAIQSVAGTTKMDEIGWLVSAWQKRKAASHLAAVGGASEAAIDQVLAKR